MEIISSKDLTIYFSYLDDLRESGETNMYGARPYLSDEYDLAHGKAGVILSSWMKTFNPNSTMEERVAMAQRIQGIV